MSDYLKSTNFATKDALPSGNAGKIVKGTELDNEFNAIADAIESKADLLNPTFSGLLTTDTLTTGGATNIGGTLAVAGALSAAEDVQFTTTGRMLVPKGTTAQRPSSPVSGSVRYNTTLNYLENYDGTVWKAVGDVVPADVSDELNTSTGYFQVPVGTTLQRPASPVNGLARYNTDTDYYEAYVDGRWHRFVTADLGSYTADYVVVAGGGGGGNTNVTSLNSGASGGGGAGGYFSGTTTLTAGTLYTITIGAGGPGGTNGYNSSISGIFTAFGGGNGGTGVSDGVTGAVGGAGGSGGGGGCYGVAAGGNGTTGQGNAGAASSGQVAAGGGGGAGTVGSGTSGGTGAINTITGSSVYYAGGGGGANGGTGGSGGGAAGGNGSSVNGGNGGANLGGGGGGGGNGNSLGGGGNGGSGVVIISVPTANYSGTTTGTPVVTTVGSNTVLRYVNSGTYTS